MTGFGTAEMTVTPMGAHFLGRRFSFELGRGGVSLTKKEGDGATPIDGFRITGCLYRPDRVARPASWAQPLRRWDLWSDDPGDPDYNQMVFAPHRYRHETLWRADPLYDIVLTTDWNWPVAYPGKGSAIFLHQWRRRGFPTAGCLAFAAQDLAWIAAHAGPGTKVSFRWPVLRRSS